MTGKVIEPAPTQTDHARAPSNSILPCCPAFGPRDSRPFGADILRSLKDYVLRLYLRPIEVTDVDPGGLKPNRMRQDCAEQEKSHW